MKDKKYCPVCKKEMEESIVDVCTTAYEYIIEKIKQEHPDWVGKDGACPKCIDYYRQL